MSQDRPEPGSSKIAVVYESVEPNGLNYARAKLRGAVWELATGTEGIKVRLEAAFVEMVAVSESDFPPELRDKWRQIRSELTSGSMRYDVIVKGGERTEVPAGLLRSTLRYMRKKKAGTIGEMIFELSARLDDYPD